MADPGLRLTDMQTQGDRRKKGIEMAKEKTGEQMPLIDVAPKNAKVIIEAARDYRKLVAGRLKLLAKEIEQKAEVLRLVKKAKLTPLEGGKIKFTYDGVTICVTPQDEKITIQEKEVVE